MEKQNKAKFSVLCISRDITICYIEHRKDVNVKKVNPFLSSSTICKKIKNFRHEKPLNIVCH